MNGKPKIAFYWCAGCGGCEETVLDLDEAVLDLVNAVEIVFWPVALDFKETDLEALPEGALLAAFINGAVRNSDQRRMAELLRRKARFVIAFGACAQWGGIPGLANLWDRAGIFASIYPDRPEGPRTTCKVDGHELELPEFYDTVQSLDRIVPVDYYLPGCPPTPNIVRQALDALLGGSLPPAGTVLAPDRALCEECPRRDSRPEEAPVVEFRRIPRLILQTHTCLLAQGVVCLGPVTRGGCEARCIQGNMPCTGCFGPTSRVRDFGGKAVSAIASLVDSNDEPRIDAALDAIPDPVGTFYRYSLPAALVPPARGIKEPVA